MTDLSEFFSGEALERAKRRQAAGEPDAYIIGKAYFYREEYEVSPAVLIPRPDTERLVETLVELLPPKGHFIDLCCGSGCIAISALAERTDCTAVGYDISPEAVEIALRNAHRNGVAPRYRAHVADVRKMEVPAGDIIVSNPPYIASSVVETLDPSVKDHEPRIALDGGTDGLDFYRVILDRFGGCHTFLFEIGYDQGDALRNLAKERGLGCVITRDYGGNDRVAVIQRR